VATAIYFGFFLVIVPLLGVIENTLMDVATTEKTNIQSATTIINNKNLENITPHPSPNGTMGPFKGQWDEGNNSSKVLIAGSPVLLISGVHVLPFESNYSVTLLITSSICFVFVVYGVFLFFNNL